MNPTPTAAPADPVLLALLAVMALGWALWTLARLLLIPAAALLLVLLGWRPTTTARPAAPAAVVPPPALLPPAPSAAPLEGLRVVELRALACPSWPDPAAVRSCSKRWPRPPADPLLIAPWAVAWQGESFYLELFISILLFLWPIL